MFTLVEYDRLVTSFKKRENIIGKSLHFLIAILISFSVIEILCAMTTLFLVERGWMAALPSLSDRQVNDFLSKQNNLLGWDPPVNEQGEVIEAEPRPDPYFSQAQSSCMSVYGDSFTLGLSDQINYPHYLARNFGCRVANFAVPGYGSDQAFILFLAQRHLDKSKIVMIGHLSENIVRNVNQCRRLLAGGVAGFKPRYVIAANQLRYVPVPVKTLEDFHLLVRNPKARLSFDAFLDRPRRAFPYSIALLCWFFTDHHVKTTLFGTPYHMSYYDTHHPAKGLELTARILTSFSREALRDGRRPIILLIPTASDLIYAKEKEIWVDEPLFRLLIKEKVNHVIHAAPQLLKRLVSRHPCEIYERCNGHFNAEGYRMLSNVVASEMRKNHWV